MYRYHCVWKKNTELIYKFWDSQAFSRNSADLDKTTLLFKFVVHESHHSTFTKIIQTCTRLACRANI